WPGERWGKPLDDAAASTGRTIGPTIASIAAGVTGPGRSSRGGRVVRSSTVDSIPPLVGPPSRTRSIRPASPRKTRTAVVGDNPVEPLAPRAATGTPASFKRA